MNFLKNLLRELGRTGQFILFFVLALILPGFVFKIGDSLLPDSMSLVIAVIALLTFLGCLILALMAFFENLNGKAFKRNALNEADARKQTNETLENPLIETDL
jgi:hypothetical protein